MLKLNLLNVNKSVFSIVIFSLNRQLNRFYHQILIAGIKTF